MAQSPVTSGGLGTFSSKSCKHYQRKPYSSSPSRLVRTRDPQPSILGIRPLRQLRHIPLRHLRQLARPGEEDGARLLQRGQRWRLRGRLLPLVQAQRRKANRRLGSLHFRPRLSRHPLLRFGMQRHRRYRAQERQKQPCGAATWPGPKRR
jgi:hypothetical protein